MCYAVLCSTYCVAVQDLIYCGSLIPYNCGSLIPCNYGSLIPCNYGSLIPWKHPTNYVPCLAILMMHFRHSLIQFIIDD